MTALLPVFALMAPLILVITAVLGGLTRRSARAYATQAILATFFAACIAVLSALGVALFGPARTGLLGLAGVGVSVQVDALAAIMLMLVGLVGLVVVRYSRNYLDGDPWHVRFTRWLLFTLAAVEALLISGNLALLILAWIATSLSLNKLLLFYQERPAAQRAARKKFLASRIGDICLLIAVTLIYAHFGTLEIADLNAAARARVITETALLNIVGILLVLTAMLKSAQLPLHGWLIEVMETPTPVSALLHAGIINAGGFLILRLADVLLLATPALEVLAVVGGVTALFGSLVMLTQTSVKVQLAYSTIAQMGFMLLQCGLGAFSSALLHIVAHSLYKAHAFLSSGSVMDLARASWTPSPGVRPHPGRLVLALAAVGGLAVIVAAGFGVTLRSNPAQIALGSVLLMGLVHLMANAIDARPDSFVIGRTAMIAVALAVLYFALQAGMTLLVVGSVPIEHASKNPIGLTIAALLVVAFGAVTVFQNQMMRRAETPFWTAAYVHLRNGFYLNTIANRLVLSYWPQQSRAKAARAS